MRVSVWFTGLVGTAMLTGCGPSDPAGPSMDDATPLFGVVEAQPGFIHGSTLKVDGEAWYLAGAPDGPNGEIDVPGHTWSIPANGETVVFQGKHYNTGPFGAPQWWSSDAPDGELLYNVTGVVDTWSAMKAERYAARGYVHYHELVNVATGELHPEKVVWFRHLARTSFTFDGGPPVPLNVPHAVTPGLDAEFINNYFVPYDPSGD